MPVAEQVTTATNMDCFDADRLNNDRVIFTTIVMKLLSHLTSLLLHDQEWLQTLVLLQLENHVGVEARGLLCFPQSLHSLNDQKFQERRLDGGYAGISNTTTF